MTSEQTRVLITGATGNHSGAVVDHLLASDAEFDALEERFGFEFTTLPEYLREHGWEDKEGMASTPGWVKAFS
jgi:hypothetical protein